MAMNQEDPYVQWAYRHAKTFGLTGDGSVEMFLEWAELFRKGGYVVPELNAATEWLFQVGCPEYARQQLQLIHERVRRIRQEDTDRMAAEHRKRNGRDHGVCAHCGDTGFVAVPHLKALESGNWPDVSYPTFAVLCSCWKGREFLAQNKREMLSLEAYVKSVPNWQSLLRERAEFLKAKQQAEVNADPAAKRDRAAWQEAMAGLLARMQARQKQAS